MSQMNTSLTGWNNPKERPQSNFDLPPEIEPSNSKLFINENVKSSKELPKVKLKEQKKKVVG